MESEDKRKPILADAGVDPNTRVRDLTSEELKKISAVIDETQVVEGDLRREIQLNIKRLKEIGCYRGIRHRKGLTGAWSEDKDKRKNM